MTRRLFKFAPLHYLLVWFCIYDNRNNLQYIWKDIISSTFFIENQVNYEMLIGGHGYIYIQMQLYFISPLLIFLLNKLHISITITILLSLNILYHGIGIVCFPEMIYS